VGVRLLAAIVHAAVARSTQEPFELDVELLASLGIVLPEIV
jgi:hypothetical protein